MELWEHQKRALGLLKNGSVLVGGTGSGKSLTALSYYLKVLGGINPPPRALYIITTAKKRDDGDWEKEAARLGIDNLVVDSWNNIKKYIKVVDSMFIFDEQRVIGYGVWTKSFLKITNRNRWILLSATPADTWTDLIPVFIANGFYRNKTEFNSEHVLFAPYVKYPKILGYKNERVLERRRDQIFVTMDYKKKTTQHTIRVPVSYNKEAVQKVLRTQWNPFSNMPIDTLAEEIHVIRRLINQDPSRLFALSRIQEEVRRLIVFYNFNFELRLMKDWFCYRTVVAEHNGHKHEPVPETENWIYLVQYNSGSEAWECFSTNHMAFYSFNYSYRTIHQARGRIDRNNTHFTDLYYYELVSKSMLDTAILKAFSNKKDFNIKMLKM